MPRNEVSPNNTKTIYMPRIASRMKIFKGQEEEYKRRHDELWPDLEELLHQTGISDYSIFLDEATGDLFAVFQSEDPAKLSDLPNHPVMKKWWAYMKDIMETNPDNSPVSTPLKDVFYMQ